MEPEYKHIGGAIIGAAFEVYKSNRRESRPVDQLWPDQGRIQTFAF
jgi:hypothetical protein